jgi:hypothetical protein
VSRPYTQELKLFDFKKEDFVSQLKLEPPAFTTSRKAYAQLRYIAEYVSHAAIGCRSCLVEDHYIDRDHMEDHSVFYSRNLFPYGNACRRVHFFRLPPDRVAASLDRLREINRREGEDAYRRACLEFSRDSYVGFAVIKPLTGSPLGRTVLRTHPTVKEGEPTYTRHFTCTSTYYAHVAGVELTVRGLPFQQQDQGVAACATTAVWSALHRIRTFENIATFTPAQITTLATKASLEFGRSMPSEGLSIDQMCQAIQAVGASPVLRRVDDFRTARGLLYSSLRSGVAPILIMVDKAGSRHAVAAVGMGLRERPLENVGNIGDRASLLEVIYLHDDRNGPYMRAELKELGSRLWLWLHSFPDADAKDEWWMLTHLLFPMHAKVRISFGELREISLDSVAATVETFRRFAATSIPEAKQGVIDVEMWIEMAHSYQRSLLQPLVDSGVANRLIYETVLSRYVGVIRVVAPFIDPIQVLIDTTGTQRNIYSIAVVAEATKKLVTMELATDLAKRLKCLLVAP